MAFTEFYCDFTNGSNVNAGSTEAAPVLSLTGGDWVSATGVYTKTGEITGVSPGMFAAVRVDGATVAARVGRVTGVTANTVTMSTTAGSGSLADQTGTASIVVGGPWKGPNAAVGFPFNFITNALTNASGDYPRVNLKNNATYSVTAAITHANAGPIQFQGYTSTVGDGGRAIIDGGTAGASYVLFTLSSGATTPTTVADMVFQNNGATGNANGVVGALQGQMWRRCVFNSFRGALSVTNTGLFEECEVYSLNQSNTSNSGGIIISAVGVRLRRCIVHDVTGSASNGVYSTAQTFTAERCIFDSNGRHGVAVFATNGAAVLSSCEFYNNGSDGVNLGSGSGTGYSVSADNCNFVKNGGYGVNFAGSGTCTGQLSNCGFGSGSAANTSGTTNALGGVVETGSVTYASGVTPWSAPDTGNFTIVLAAAKAAGRGSYTQTQSNYTGTSSSPDIGAAQATSAGGGGKFWPRRLR